MRLYVITYTMCIAVNVSVAAADLASVVETVDELRSLASHIPAKEELKILVPYYVAHAKAETELGKLYPIGNKTIEGATLYLPEKASRPGDPCSIVRWKSLTRLEQCLDKVVSCVDATVDSDSDSSVTGLRSEQEPVYDVELARIKDALLPTYAVIENSVRENLDQEEIRCLTRDLRQYRIKEGAEGDFDVAFVERRWRRWLMGLWIAVPLYRYTEAGAISLPLYQFLLLLAQELKIEEKRKLIPPNILKVMWGEIDTILRGPASI